MKTTQTTQATQKQKKFEWPWNKGILSYKEVQELRDTIPTEEYNSLVLKSIEHRTLWEFITIPFWRLGYIISETWYSVKTYCYNAWKFRKELAKYRGWDFSYDLDMLIKMYEIKIESFEIAKDYIEEGSKLLEEIKGIYSDLVWLNTNDYLDANYIKVYKKTFKKLQESYKYWW